MFAGPNGSGKSTIREDLRQEWLGHYVNSDELEKLLTSGLPIDLGQFDLTSGG